MTWEKFEIGNFVELRQGLAINKSTQKYLSNEVTYLPLLRIGDMKDGNFNVFINDSVPEKFIAKESDIIYTRTGKVGLVFRKQYGVIHNNCFTVSSKDESILIQEFLYYVLQEKSFYEEALSRATGAAQPDLPHGAFSSIEIFLPPIDKQKNIVEILNAYNDLIENNQKQIKLLEEAAQRLYKEWFVDLHFPGYETTPIIDGVPEGWKMGKLEEIIIYHDKRRKPLSSLERDTFKGEYRYFGAAGILDYVADYLFDGTYLLFGEDGTVITDQQTPVLQYVTGKFWVNNHAHVLTGKSYYTTEYLYMMFKNMKVSDIVTGVAQPKISQARLSGKKILIPKAKIVIAFQEKVENIFKCILNLEKKNEFAKEARDRLIPKLMSGELEV